MGAPVAAAIVPILMVLIVIGAIAFAVFPVYPKVTATFQIKSTPQDVVFLSAKLDRLTIAAASGIQKDTVFLYSLAPDTNGYMVTVVVEVSYSGQTLATSPSSTVVTGLYSISFVGNLRAEQPSVYYHVKVTVTFPSGPVIVKEVDVPPS
jgi:hypothetical protein